MKFNKIDSRLNNKLLFIVIVLVFISNSVVHLYRLTSYDQLLSPDARLYADISYSIRNFSSTIIEKKSNFGLQGLDIGYTILPGYPFLITPFFENIHLISLFQTLLFAFSIFILFQNLSHKYLSFYLFINFLWLILATSWSYHVSILIESPSISILMIIIYYLDKYLKDYQIKDFIWFSIWFGILILINNRYIFHYCGFITFFTLIIIFNKKIKFKHILFSFLIVTAILTPWHIRQYLVYKEIVLFSPVRNKALKRANIKDSLSQNLVKIQDYKNYLIDSSNSPLRDDPVELASSKKLYLDYLKESERKSRERLISGEIHLKQPKRIIFEPEMKKKIEVIDTSIARYRDKNLLNLRSNLLGISNKNREIHDDKFVRNVIIKTPKINSKYKKNEEKFKAKGKIKVISNNKRITELIAKINKINNTNFDKKNIALFAYQIDSIRLKNKSQYAKIIFDIINQADSVGLPDIKYSILGIPKPIDSTLVARNAELKTQNSNEINKSTKKLNTNKSQLKTNVDSLYFFASNLQKGLNELKILDVKAKDSLIVQMQKEKELKANKAENKNETPEQKIVKNLGNATTNNNIQKVDTNLSRPILVINKNIDSTTELSNSNYLDSLLIFPIFAEIVEINKIEPDHNQQQNKNVIRFDTVSIKTAKQILPDLNSLNPRKQVTIDDGKNKITIEDNKVAMIKVGDFENQKEFQKFENLRVKKMVPPYNEIIDALLKSHPKFGSTPEKLMDFLSDFSYSKYKQLVYNKFEPSNKYELIWNRFKEQFIFFRTDFRLTPQWDARIYFPSHYNNWIQFLLDLIMMPLVIINIIPLIIAIYKKDWLIMSLGVLVFLHILLHALVGYIPRYRVTIYPVWITFAVYGYDQITRYFIHVYKNRADYKARVSRLLEVRGK